MSSTSNTAVKKDLTKLQRAIIDGLEDVKAQDIQVFDTEHLSPLFERVIVATGTSNRQTKAIASSVRDAVKKAGFATPRHEGEASGEWIIVDCNQAVVHIMQPAIRQYYRLEEIWGEKPVRVKLGGAKVSKRTALEDARQDAPAAPPPKNPSVRKTASTSKTSAASTTAAEPKASTKPRAASTRSASSATTSASAAKKAPAKKPMTTTKVAGGAAAAVKKAPARKPAAPKAEAAIKTVVVKPTTARGAAKKPAAVRKAAAAKKA